MNALNISAERLEHLRHLEAHLCEQIRGQDHVIPRIVAALHRGELGLTSPTRPRGSFLFLGPTGVGKTETTIAFTALLVRQRKTLPLRHVRVSDTGERCCFDRRPCR